MGWGKPQIHSERGGGGLSHIAFTLSVSWLAVLTGLLSLVKI